MEKHAAEFKEAAVIDQPGVFQLFCHSAHTVTLVHLNGDLDIILIQRAQVVKQQPTHAGQQTGDKHHARQIQGGTLSAALFPVLFLFRRGSRALTAHLLGVIIGGFVIVLILGHNICSFLVPFSALQQIV